jgi:hypothetical protein
MVRFLFNRTDSSHSQDGELSVFAPERRPGCQGSGAMRRRKLRWQWGPLKQLTVMKLMREELLTRLAVARKQARTGLAPARDPYSAAAAKTTEASRLSVIAAVWK